MQSDLKRTNILGVGVSALDMNEAVRLILEARASGKTGYVCVTGVHGIIESQRDSELKTIHNSSFLTVPDGMPTVWLGKEQGYIHMGRVYGPDLMLAVCEATAKVAGCSTMVDKAKPKGTSPRSQVESLGNTASPLEAGSLDTGGTGESGPVAGNQQPATRDKLFTHFLYGSTPEVLEKMKTNFEKKFPGIQIVGIYSPPFRAMTDDEEKELQRLVAAYKPDFFWVGLSTPKQERFMATHAPLAKSGPVDCCSLMVDMEQPNVSSSMSAASESSTTSNYQSSTSTPARYPLEAGIMLGVGAAFDIHAGLLKDAPGWIKNSGLQWFYRLCQEPRRLWRRYLDIVPSFLWLAALQLLGIKQYELEGLDE